MTASIFNTSNYRFTLFRVFATIVSMNTSMVSRSMDDSEELEDGETTGEIQANKVELNFNVSVSHIVCFIDRK